MIDPAYPRATDFVAGVTPLSQPLSVPLPTPRRPRSIVRSTTVMGQCKVCLDMFSVDLYAIGKDIYVNETPRIKWNRYSQDPDTILVHRPDLCKGQIKLYGSIKELLSQE